LGSFIRFVCIGDRWHWVKHIRKVVGFSIDEITIELSRVFRLVETSFLDALDSSANFIVRRSRRAGRQG